MGDSIDLDFSGLRAAYWRIRAERTPNRRRKWYRVAQKEKARLAGLGYSQEVVRLYALYLRNPKLESRLDRFQRALDEWQNGPRQLTLF